MRLRLVRENTSIDFFSRARIWLGISMVAMVIAFASFLIQGLNFGIDFTGGTSIRTDSAIPVDVGAYRAALETLELGDISIAEVNDVLFDEDQHVALVRVQAQEGDERIASETIEAIQSALRTIDPDMAFPSVESVGPKVSGELIQTSIIAVALAVIAILLYIWLRFEWQFAVGAVLALSHDVILTIGIFSELQIKFDLAIIAALLTIVGYSINDTVIVFDRVRENLRKYKKKDLKEVLNVSINETLSRTLMTSVTTMLALLALFTLGGDVIRGFVFAMMWGVLIGTYSSIFVASAILLVLGVKRDWSKKDPSAGTKYGHIET
ncbi:protein translocase subunit SecF [Roseobacter sp. CCS2]|uniref:protein translocase subunit SecF n=1 Tax=Roseobacter sp. CCS2 TaxID=391593 RepID=UPI0002E30336|nr:protein translocase subunit SecF [Roseobacter sp. CCS2]